MKRICLVIAVVVVMAATLCSAPAFAQTQTVGQSINATPNANGKFFACYRGKTISFDTRKQRRAFLRRNHSARIGRC